MKRIENIFQTIKLLCEEQYSNTGQVSGVSTDEVATRLNIQRPNVSSDLNALAKAKRLEKVDGKPVLYKVTSSNKSIDHSPLEGSVLDTIIGADKSLKTSVQQAKAAVMYPPLGLHTLLLGETGVGKSMFAEAIFSYAQNIGRLKNNAPFVAFNCADYAHNPQLLLVQLFGAKKGCYTGAERDRIGLVEKANHGILFLDEVHRLPPEGQEMLFYLIDKGAFRSMGEVEAYRKVEVLIICATTENVGSSLLATFTRRIPMIIKLPAIRERTLNERWELIKNFFSREVEILKVPVSVSPNALKAFMLYDCSNNIGQLKSDIKLSCARAFLDYASGKDKLLKVHSEDLPEYILRGFIKYKQYRDDIDKMGLTKDIIFQFSNEAEYPVKDHNVINIYEVLEQKMRNLKAKGMGEQDVQLIMGLDIDTYIQQYMANFRKGNLEELYKVVDRKIVTVTQDFLWYCTEQLSKQFNDTILFGMSIHISSTLERIREGKTIYNPHLAEIQKTYSSEFSVATHLGVLLKDNFGVQIPAAEIGFITMFLAFDEYPPSENSGRVGVIIAMHGTSTATSMAEVANRLLGQKRALGYDMPLDKKTEVALDEISQLVEQQNEKQGVILLVDMGSLVMFGDIIQERTSIPIKTIEMASTPMVLEATRKALMRASLDEIYHAVTNLSPYIGRIYTNPKSHNYLKDDVIVTACITGKGTAIKLKNMIEKSCLVQGRNFHIIPLEISNMEDFNQKLLSIKQEKNIIAVVSSLKPQDKTVNYVSTKDLIEGKWDMMPSGIMSSCVIPNLKTGSVMAKLRFMQNAINENLNIDGQKFMEAFNLFYLALEDMNMAISEDASIGLILHLACVVEKLIAHEPIAIVKSIENLDLHKYRGSCNLVKAALQPLEETFKIKLPNSEYYNVVKLIHFI